MSKYIIAGFLLFVFAWLQYRLWIEENGMRDTIQLKNAILAQHQENTQMRERNRALLAEVWSLKHGKEAIEEQARSELGMIKKGEQFYQIPNPTPSSNSSS